MTDLNAVETFGAPALVTDPRRIVYDVADNEDDAPADEASADEGPAPVAAGAMVAATVTWKRGVDPLNVLGVSVRDGVYLLPFAEWPSERASIDLPEVTITKYVPAKPRPTFKKGLPKGLYDLPPLPSAAPAGHPLVHEDFWTWLAPLLPDRGPVAPVERSHPAFARLVATAKAGLASARINAGANIDTGWGRLAHDVEHVTRRCGLPIDAAFSVLRPAHPMVTDDELRAAIGAAVAGGLSAPGDLRDTIIADVAAETEAAQKEAARVAAAKAREAERIEIDLATAGLCLFESDDPLFRDPGAPIGPRVLFRAGGLPVGDVTVPIVIRTREAYRAPYARLRSVGVVMMTRAEHDAAAVLPDEIVVSLRAARNREVGDRRYSSKDFTGTPRTVSGRTALLAFRTHAATLVHALANARGHSDHAAYLHHLLVTLGVAYGPEVSIANQIDSLQEACRAHVRGQSHVRIVSPRGPYIDGTASRPWPSSVPAIDTIGRAVLAELARGSAWRFGELLREPSPEEARAIRHAVDPQALETAVAEAAGDAAEVRSQSIYDRLAVENLIAGTTPSPAERGRVSAALEKLGFARSETTADGTRARCWRRRGA